VQKQQHGDEQRSCARATPAWRPHFKTKSSPLSRGGGGRFFSFEMLRRFRTPALSEARLASLLADANTRAAGGAPIVSVSSENSYYIEGEPGLDPSSPALSWLLSETFEPQCYGEASFLDEVRDGAAR
jgi:hypothetical protein